MGKPIDITGQKIREINRIRSTSLREKKHSILAL